MQSPLAIAPFSHPLSPSLRFAYRGIKFPLVASSPLSLAHTHTLALSLLLALVSRGKHELERNERHSSEKLRFQGATGNLCCFYPRLANRFSRFRVSLVRKANFIDAIEGSGGMGDRNWRIVIGYRKRRHGGCVFANFVATKLSTLPFYLLERNGRNSRSTSAFTALYSPRFTLGPRFHERPSVLIFGRHTTRVFASNGRFPSNYVDGGEFSAFSFPTTRVSRARVNRVDIIYFSEISFFSTHTLARTDFIWTALGKGMFATGTGKYR